MTYRLVHDWNALVGAAVEIHQNDTVVCTGIVDAVTNDDQILWIQSPVEGRRLFERAESFQAWATDERTGFHYKVSRDDAIEQASMHSA
jgi:hypothetical protein